MNLNPSDRFQVYLKGEPVSVEPDTYYEQFSDACVRLAQLREEQPHLGKLEVRQVP